MDLFPIGGFVRLRSRAQGKYVHADEDAVHVNLRPLDAVPSLNAVWKVDRWTVEGGDDLLLLQGCAYGRYLAVAQADEVRPLCHHGVRAVQRDYDSLDLDPTFMWTHYRVEASKSYVRLHNDVDDQRCLRANGRRRHESMLLTVDVWKGSKTLMMQWRVEAIPSTPVPLPLPPPPPQPPIHERHGLFSRCWRIRYKRFNNDGIPVTHDHHRLEFVFEHKSVSKLRTEVRRLRKDKNITLGVRAGSNARVIPLISDLPDNTDPIQIVIYTTGSPAAAQLRYPQFDEPGA